MSKWVWILALQLGGCGGAGGGPEAGGGAAKWSPSVDGQVSTGVAGLADAALAQAPPCRALIEKATPDALAAEVLPFDQAAVQAACGPIAGLYDARSAELHGTARQADELLRALANVGDEAAFLGAQLGSDGARAEIAVAVAHVDGALSKVVEVATRTRAEPLRGYELRLGGDDREVWLRALHSDSNGIGAAQDFMSRLAFNQGIDPTLVRQRVIGALLALAHTQLEVRRTAMAEATLPAAERAAREAYLDASTSALAVFDGILARFAAGEVTDDPIRDELAAQGLAAHEAWHAAWLAEVTRAQAAAATEVEAAPAAPAEDGAQPADPQAETPAATDDPAPAQATAVAPTEVAPAAPEAVEATE